MPHIKELRKEEMDEMIYFVQHIEDYGHIFYGENSELDPAFIKIIDGINEVKEIIENYYSY